MPDVKLAVTIDGAEHPQDAPVLVLANPIGTNVGIWRLTVIRGASHFAHFQAPGPVTDALVTHFQEAR